jgi:uncharacterized membrane protein
MEPIASPAQIAHVHLLLNHVPTFGTVLGIGLLLLAFSRRSDDLKKVGLEVFFVVALATLPAYLSGVAAQEPLRELDDVSRTAIAAHQDAALWAFLLMQVTGALAWLGLWQFRRRTQLPRRAVAVVLALALVTLAAMTRTALIAGGIRHPEVLAGGEAAVPAAAAQLTSGIAAFIQRHSWVWPAAESLHFIGMSLVFGVLLVVNLRVLGFMRRMSFAAAHYLLPWGILGFAVNLVTGMLFFIGESHQYVDNGAFYWKMIFLLLAGANYLYLTVVDDLWALAPGDRPRLVERLIAASSLCLWMGVMYFGRMLPFLGTAF